MEYWERLLGRLTAQLRLENGVGLHMVEREARPGKRGHFLLRQLREQRQKDVNHRACSGNPTRQSLIRVQQKGRVLYQRQNQGQGAGPGLEHPWSCALPTKTSLFGLAPLLPPTC